MGLSARISASSSEHKSISSSTSTGSTALDEGGAEPKSTSLPPASSRPSSLSMGRSNHSMLKHLIVRLGWAVFRSYGWRG
ncbi:hypothetical protein K443DRAFT_678982 [Laccaria amethystina LaAM-08-1]|uniref:Uncharacterized protein n=1 Tax=Laccaria amethystina LaAM-08-1 TaxID=1095629 RepID=A0A0C9WQP4_9AGAR|nr:hypothetical protein K443DRAFT_678982 [Laccaria amethystina LaAM-08-1]